MCHVLKCDYDAIKQFLDSMELDPGKLIMKFKEIILIVRAFELYCHLHK